MPTIRNSLSAGNGPGHWSRFQPPAVLQLGAKPGRRGLGAFLFMLIAGLLGSADLLQAQGVREYELKAVLLFNLTRFVEWPPESFAEPESPLVIGILGRDPYGKVLDELVRSEAYRLHKIQVVRFAAIESVKDCQMLFVSAEESQDLPRILSWLKDRPVLTVGDFDGFSLRGGMIGLNKSNDGKIQLHINLGAVKASGLRVSGKLLQVAAAVDLGTN